MSEYQRVPHNEALYIKIAKILSQDSDLVERYRGAVARVPRDKDWGDHDPKDEAFAAAYQMLDELNEIIRKLEPSISQFDCLEARRYLADWVFGRRMLD